MAKEILKIPESGQKIIDSYLNMSIANKVIACPYFINLKKFHAVLRVFLGKGSAQEIINEIKFIAQKERIDLAPLSEIALYRFITEHNLGIDCSGLAVYILREIYRQRGVDFVKKIKIVSFWKNPWRYFLARLRPIENISVAVLANDKNSFIVDDFKKILPGDMIIRENLRHVYLIVKIEKENDKIIRLTYVHAPRPKENYFGPGIFQKTIILKEETLEELKEKLNDQVIIRRLKI